MVQGSDHNAVKKYTYILSIYLIYCIVRYDTLSRLFVTPLAVASIMMSTLHNEGMMCSDFRWHKKFLINDGDPLGGTHMGMLLRKRRVYLCGD